MAAFSKPWHQSFFQLISILPVVSALGDTVVWINPRAAVIGDVILIQGGERYTTENNVPTQLEPSDFNYLYNISLDCTIDVQGSKAQKLDALLGDIQQRPVLGGAKIWWGGGLFWNDYEFYTFGGLASPRQGSLDSSVIQGTLYQPSGGAAFNPSNVNVGQWNPSSSSSAAQSLNKVSTNVANGAWTSAPSENLAWWFGGMQALNGGPIDSNPVLNQSDAANTTSKQFTQVDLRSPGAAIFTPLELSSNIQASAEGALVWLPYSKQGILLAFGGVTNPADMQSNGVATNATQQANDFMTNINVFDVATQKWAIQPTLQKGEAPKQLAQFCTAVAVASDGTGYFVYVYGGYDGTYGTIEPVARSRDEVWVLSVPAFQWTKINSGIDSHRRQNHICVTPNPSQMISIGGMVEFAQPLENGSMIEVYDFNKNEWTGYYNASSSEPYKVRSEIVNQIGTGTSSGGFDKLPSSLDPTVSSFVTSRGARPIAYPARTCGASSTATTPTSVPNPEPAWKKPVEIAVPLVVVLALVAGLVFFCLRRNRKVVDAESRTEMRQNKVTSWIHKSSGHDPPPAESHSTGRTDDTRIGTEVGGYFARAVPKTVQTEIYEAPSDMASPISHNASGHGTPYNIASPALSGSHEVDAASRHEMDGQGTSEATLSFRNHPLYPNSFAGTQIGSTSGGSVSHPSESLKPNPWLGHISPYELPEDKSNENLSQPPNDLSLNDDESNKDREQTKSANAHVSEVRSPATISPTSPITRKPLNKSGQTHHRQTSSMSSKTYNLPSPGPEEDERRSTFLDSLPDQEGRSSPGYPQRQIARQPSGPIRSAYQEKFDDIERR